MKAIRCGMLLLALSFICGTVRASEAPPPLPPKAVHQMQAMEYEAAAETLAQHLKTHPANADEIRLVRALALFYAKHYDAVLAETDALLREHPDSPWRHKAIFTKARALIEQKRFQEAAALYEDEARRLLSETRKGDIAAVIVRFADESAADPDPARLDAPPPNYAQACNLYSKVLEMEIGRGLRDDVLFKKGVALQKAGNAGGAVESLEAYLKEFDPAETSGAGHPAQAAGRHVLEARFHLADALLQAGNPARARREAEDLLKRLSAAPGSATNTTPASLAADTRWLMVRSHNPPTPDSTGPDAAIEAANAFLAAYPADPRAMRAAFLIAQIWQQGGRSEEALAAYRRFAAGEGFRLPEGAAAMARDKDFNQAPAELKETWEREALFQVGSILFAQGKHTEAAGVWQDYIRRYPNGAQWAACQEGVINAEFQTALKAQTEKRTEEARKLFDAFLAAHPLDARARQILFLYGQAHFAKVEDLAKNKGKAEDIAAASRQAIDEWARLISKYPNTEEASLALYRTAMLQEERLGDFDKALDSYKRLNWGAQASAAQQQIGVLTQKSLALRTERKFRTNEPAVVLLRTRNIPKLTIRRYTLDLEAYFRKTHGTGRVEDLDVGLIQPDKTWEVPVAGYAKYKLFEQSVEIPWPDGEPGVCVITAGEEDWEATTLVVRSDLDLILKSSRREALVFVEDMVRQQPAKGVKVLLSDGERVFTNGVTGRDGVYTAACDELKSLESLRAFALRDGHVAAQNVDLQGLGLSEGLSPKGYLYTDRPAYRPGEEVGARGILRAVRDGSYAVPTQAVFVVSVTDAGGRLLREEEVTLSEFGTFHTRFTLPENTPPGDCVLSARGKGKAVEHMIFTTTFPVRELKLERMRLTLTFPRRVYFRGETVDAAISAAYYWGEPLADKAVRCRLPDGRTVTGRTDALGAFAATFDTSGMTPGSLLAFEASLEGENVSAREAVSLAVLGFGLAVQPARDVALAGESLDVVVHAMAADGRPAEEALTLRVIRRDRPKPDPLLEGVPWIPRDQAVAEVTVQEIPIKTAASGDMRQPVTIAEGGDYVLRVTGQDRFKQTVTGEATVTISGEDDATRLRLFADTDNLRVGARAAVRLHARVEKGLALVTHEGETILQHQIVPVTKGLNDLSFDVSHADFPNMRVAVAMMDGRELRTAAREFTVERELKVKIEPVRAAYQPGEEAQVKLTVTDQLGRPVRAEFSLGLVEEALYAVVPDSTPRVLDFFQADAHREVEFRVGATCGFLYEGVSRRVVKEVVEEGARLVRAGEEAATLNREAALGDRGDMLQTDAVAVNQLNVGANASLSVLGRSVINGNGRLIKNGSGALTLSSGGTLSLTGSNTYSGGTTIANGTTIFNGGILQFGNGRGGQWDVQSNAAWGMSGLSGGGGFVPTRREEAVEARWLPAIVTDDKGEALVPMPLPQKATGWRLTARGCTVETLVGEATAPTLTRKDLFVEVRTPSFLREGDAFRAFVRVHNLTNYTGAASVRLTIYGEGDKPLAAQERRVDLKPSSTAEVTFDPVTLAAAGNVRVEVRAEAGKLQDAVSSDVAVRPWGMEYAAHGGGVANADTSLVLELPAGIAYSNRWLTVSVGPSLQQTVIELAQSDPVDRFCGLDEATAGDPGGDLLATVSGLAYARRCGVGGAEHARLVERARGQASGLVADQREDGGWSWEGRKSDSDWGASSRAFWALAEARDLGVLANTNTLARAQKFLQDTFQKLGATDYDAKSVVLHALSVAKAADFANCNRLYRERNGLGAAAAAYTALAFQNLERPEIAAEMLAILDAKKESASNDLRRVASWDPKAGPPWMQDRVETTALVLLAYARAGSDAPVAHAALAYLLNARGCFGMQPARARGPVVAALAAWFGKGQYAPTDSRITVTVNGQPVETLVSKGAQPTRLLEVPAGHLKGGRNLVEFKMEGRGAYAYAATLRGFSSEFKDPQSWSWPNFEYRHYYHAPLEYKGRPLGVNSTSEVKNLEAGQRMDVALKPTGHIINCYMAIEESLPAGTRLVEGSVSGNFIHCEEHPTHLVFYYRPNQWMNEIRYQVVGYAPGAYRTQPSVMRDAVSPGRFRLGPALNVSVLAPGAASPDPYQINNAELNALGTAYFTDGDYAQALKHLADLFQRDRTYNERELARMLLWIYTSPNFYDARKVVEMFEILRERYPELEIPFDKILQVGQAYRDIGEFERAWLVFRATIAASFVSDSGVSAVLQDEGRFLGSVDYQEALSREYPDTADVLSSTFALSQALYQKAPDAHKLPKEGDRVPEKIAMLERAAGMLDRFIALYPADPLADDAAFSLANADLDLKRNAQAVELSRDGAARYTNGTLVSSFQYVAALGLFKERRHADALTAARVVADGESADRDYARYIMGQIYHAEGQPAEAIAWYRKVTEQYPDAREAIGYFEEQRIGLDEVTTVKPGDPVEVKLTYRNIREAFLQVYKVDLMKLYLQEKNLSRITQVRLGGIKPTVEMTVTLGDGKDYVEKERKLRLEVKDEGAYLIICRGDDLFASGLVLVTPLKIEVQEDAASGRVRANVLDAVQGGYRAEVHVKAIGSADREFRSGDTDLRGLFVADNLRGKATVIAREGEARYAFYRGAQWVGAPEQAPPPPQPAEPAQQLDYQSNLRMQNGTIQGLNVQQFEQMRRQVQKGVKVDAAL